MEGWIKLHRKIVESPAYFSEPFCRNMAWIDLLLLANHNDKFFRVRGIRVDISTGQVGYTSESLAKRWKWSRGKVSRFLNELQKDKQIVQQKNNVTTLISISKYKEYQTGGTAKSTTDSATDSTTDGHQTDINKNVKNDKKEIILFLNQKLQSSFKETEKTFNFIEARFNQKFTLADFKLVIENQTKEWINNPNMKKYLRPETLFGNKFEGYLQSAKIKNQRTQQTQLINSVAERDALFGDR